MNSRQKSNSQADSKRNCPTPHLALNCPVNWSRHRLIFLQAGMAVGLVAGISFLTPISLSAVRADDPMSRIWLLLSDSGAQWGISIVLLLVAIWLTASQPSLKARLTKGLIFMGGLSALIVALAALNEVGLKQFTKIPRPYAKFLEREGVLSAKEIYAGQTRSERSKFLREALKKNADHAFVKSLHPAIREHWIGHTGFSFPSGHSMVAFFLATTLAIVIERLLPNGQRWIWVPFLWATGIALSRAAIGAHSPLDVTVGALTGAMLGGLTLAVGILDRLLPPSENHA